VEDCVNYSEYPRPDAALQVKVSGRDGRDRWFEEISTILPSSKGVMLETVHDLREGTSLQLVHIGTNHKEFARVKSIGPRLGVSTLVFLDGAGIESFWAARPGVGSGEGGNTLAPREQTAISKLKMPTFDRMMEALNEIMASSLEANLRPTLEELSAVIPDRVARARDAVFADTGERLQHAGAEFSERLQTRSTELLTLADDDLKQKIENVQIEADKVAARIQSKSEEVNTSLSHQLKEMQRTWSERLEQQAEQTFGRIHAQLESSLQDAVTRSAAQFQERCSSTIQEIAKQFLQQLDTDLALRREMLQREAERYMGDAAANQRRLAHLLRQVAGIIDLEPAGAEHTANASLSSAAASH
jgi:hypothetical protein